MGTQGEEERNKFEPEKEAQKSPEMPKIPKIPYWPKRQKKETKRAEEAKKGQLRQLKSQRTQKITMGSKFVFSLPMDGQKKRLKGLKKQKRPTEAIKVT